MGGMGTRARWLACGVLAVAIAALAFSFRGSDPQPTAASATSGPTSAAPSTVAPDPSATPSASSLHTPKASDMAPVRPEAAKGPTVSAAEALVRYFLGEAHNHLKATGDGRSVTEISHSTCAPCSSEVERFANFNAANHRLSGDYLWRNISVRSVRRSGERSMVVEVNAWNGKHRAVMKPGGPVSNFAGGTASLVVTLITTNSNWSVFDVEAR